MSDSVTEEQRAYHLKKMRTRFARLDLNKDGFISHEDYELMGKRLAEHGNLTKEQAESVHKSLMVIADNIVLLKRGEKIPIQKAIQKSTESLLNCAPDKRKAMAGVHSILFDIIDLNKDGHISPEELKVYFKVIAPELSEADVSKIFEVMDTNKTGEISREELVCASEDFFYGAEETELSKVFMGPLLD